MTLKFYVKNQTLVYCGKDTVASGSKNYLYADFRFTKEWAGLTKTAVFISSDGSRRYHMLLDGGRCSVPAEIIAEGGFYISVFGGDRITSTQVYIDVEESGVEPGLTPPEPTKDVYNQILSRINYLATSLDEMYVTGSMIADSSVTESKIADGAVSAEKLADGAVGIEKLADEVINRTHAHNNKEALDKFDLSVWEELVRFYNDISTVLTNAHEVREFQDTLINEWYIFPFEVGELFELYNETEDDISYLHYNDEVVWKFSQTLEAGKTYLMKIVSVPVAGVDSLNGEIEVIKVVSDSAENVISMMYGMINEMAVQIKELSEANDTLEELLTEGVR